jgi:hypothetical protein
MLSRRGFLIGAGGLLTATFIKDAQSFVLRNDKPLLVSPSQTAGTLFWYDNDEQGLLLTLGEWQFCPPPPTWREFFVSEGIPHRTEGEAQLIWTQHDIGPERYDEPVDEYWWETRFDLETGPMALSATVLLGAHAQAATAATNLEPVTQQIAAPEGSVPVEGFGVILDRSQGREVEMAYHTSHSSHASHGSHCSGYSYC